MKYKITCPYCKYQFELTQEFLMNNELAGCMNCNKAHPVDIHDLTPEQVDFFDFKPEPNEKTEQFVKEYLGDWWEEMKNYQDD
jgi:uncharacterized Zn finger protein